MRTVMEKKVWLVLLAAVLISACASASQPTTTPLTKVRLPMGYIPNVQYAPFYVAVEKGYFKENSIEVDFDYQFETDGMALVGADELQFTLASGEQVLMARAQGLPVVYVFNWWDQYPVAVVAKEGSGLKTPADLKGKQIGLPGLFGANYIGLRALLQAGGLTENDVLLDSIGFNQVEALATGREQAVVVYANNEPFQLQAQGIKTEQLRVADYVDLISNGLVTNEKAIAENPELVQRMVNAIQKGVEYTIANPDEAYEICKKFVGDLEQTNEFVQRNILNSSIGFWKAEQLGHSDPLAWENMQQVLLDMQLIKEPLPLEEAYTNQFIQ